MWKSEHFVELWLRMVNQVKSLQTKKLISKTGESGFHLSATVTNCDATEISSQEQTRRVFQNPFTSLSSSSMWSSCIQKKTFTCVSRAHIFGSAPHEELLRRNIEWALSAFCLKHLLLIISEINETLQGHLNTKQNLQNFADERAQYTDF